ncbi:SET methyltransferase domain containing protein [Nitzschia inconspicua]|uniref:SET methyltransferase domain containing protein n=1 Tax=Nitzschia inconspicua TaxID=303405 RepID=A0A9K3LYW2_9STRA|nr:SET methyltransferase domain containing protein [Nitzschia inconspicua]
MYVHYLSALACIIFILSIRYCEALNLTFPGGAGLSYQNGVLRIKLPTGGRSKDPKALFDKIPPIGTPPPTELIQVKDTGTVKGYGAFAKSPLPRGTFLGFYEGDLVQSRECLDRLIDRRVKEWSLNHDKVTTKKESSPAMDYVMSLDGGMTFLDGYARAMNRSVFSPVHLNHADKGTPACNCVRFLEQKPENDQKDGHGKWDSSYTVAFFTSRDIEENEELCFDYGFNFWKGREKEKV